MPLWKLCIPLWLAVCVRTAACVLCRSPHRVRAAADPSPSCITRSAAAVQHTSAYAVPQVENSRLKDKLGGHATHSDDVDPREAFHAAAGIASSAGIPKPPGALDKVRGDSAWGVCAVHECDVCFVRVAHCATEAEV